jgi:hypothetical protein
MLSSLLLERWLSGKNENCFSFFHERSESGNQEATVPKDNKFE